MQKKSKYCETSAHYDDRNILVKSLNDQIDFLKREIKSKNATITMILDDHKKEVGQAKPFGNRREKNTCYTMTTTNTSFRPLKKSQK